MTILNFVEYSQSDSNVVCMVWYVHLWCVLRRIVTFKHYNSNLRDSIIRRFFLNHHNLEPLCFAKITASTVAKLLIPNYADWKNTAIWNESMLFQMRCFGTALNPLNVTG